MPMQEFEVKMTCGGCSGAVTKALTKLDGASCRGLLLFV